MINAPLASNWSTRSWKHSIYLTMATSKACGEVGPYRCLLVCGMVDGEFKDSDLLSALKRLWKRGIIRLSKPDTQRLHASEYSGNEEDDSEFFFTAMFNASMTDDGRLHWDTIRDNRSKEWYQFFSLYHQAVAHPVNRHAMGVSPSLHIRVS